MQEKKSKINLNNKTILVTGAAGFIGANLSKRLLEVTEGSTIIGIDNLNNYYDVDLKEQRLESVDRIACQSKSKWIFLKTDITDTSELELVFRERTPHIVVNLAAQAGVRNSIVNPKSYILSNIEGFFNILECCRYDESIEHLVYASSSSVYGGRTEVPFKETDDVSYPVSLYASTKKSNELLAHSYAKLYNIPSTGLRFFTVYGPAGRPDMAYFSFAEKLKRGEKIDIFNYGNCQRDFTYVDDIVEGIIRVMKGAPKKSMGEDGLPIPPYEIYNIGNSRPENLIDFVNILSEELIRANVIEPNFDIKQHMNLLPMQPGDVPVTYADISKLENDYGYKPSISLRQGLRLFAEWYNTFIRTNELKMCT